MLNTVATRVPEFSAKEYVAEHLKEKKDQLRDLAKELGLTKLTLEMNVCIGVPYDALLKDIKEKKPDLLVMGAKGRSNPGGYDYWIVRTENVPTLPDSIIKRPEKVSRRDPWKTISTAGLRLFPVKSPGTPSWNVTKLEASINYGKAKIVFVQRFNIF